MGAMPPSARAGAFSGVEELAEFVNTAVLGTGASEAFPDPGSARRWLARRGWLARGERVTRADWRRLRAFREALRAFLHAKGASGPDPRTLRGLNASLARARLAFSVGPRGEPRVRPRARGVDGAIGRLLCAVLLSMWGGDWAFLRACRNGTCRMAFVDRSRNRSRVWCDMAICGNRMKARRYRRRHG
jgi:predicted RNA-binding Zn ribbon-like protein